MKLRFDHHQPHQEEAIRAVLGLFEGARPPGLSEGARPPGLSEGARSPGLSGSGRAAALPLMADEEALGLSDAALLANLRAVQARGGLPPSPRLVSRDFAVEMETGTGKTYVYLRTLLALHARHGFSRFVVVVPSVAIREGVLKSLAVMREPFERLFGPLPLEAWVYEAGQASRLRAFAEGAGIQLVILNLDAFNKPANNVIHQPLDRLGGRRPIDYLRAARPVVVLDEPQNMESEGSRRAIAALAPALTLRYSATHRSAPHLLHRLDPARAYALRLVKRIEVDAVEVEGGELPFLRVEAVEAAKGGPRAKLQLEAATPDGLRRKTLTVRGGEDLRALAGGREAYAGWLVEALDAGAMTVAFGNGRTLGRGEALGEDRDAQMRLQVEATVREHLEKERLARALLPPGLRMKVLSLFFVDRVAHYAEPGGKIRRWLEEAYLALAPAYPELDLPAVGRAHGGYFAQVQGRPRDTRGQTLADEEAYALIMRDKERLLSPDEPLRFLFSHSALREGWDNPNVFQVCTLAESRSPLKKRQEIGRGLRLPVLETGERCHDPRLQRLTVIANESYEAFARALQEEYREECGAVFEGEPQGELGGEPGRDLAGIGDARARRRREREGGALGDESLLAFLAAWGELQPRLRYALRFDGRAIADEAAAALAALPPLADPRLAVRRAELVVSPGDRFTPKAIPMPGSFVGGGARPIIDEGGEAPPSPMTEEVPGSLLAFLEAETHLTFATLARCVRASGRLEEARLHPAAFRERALAALREAMARRLAPGLCCERGPDGAYEMALAEDPAPPEGWLRLPDRWRVETPLGEYRPRWARVERGGARLLLSERAPASS